MGKSTLVSVLPFALTEEKPGLMPGYYEIPAAERDSFSTLIVKDGYHHVLIPLSDDKAPPMRVTDTSEQIVSSLINDYTNSCLAIDYETNALPGLFSLEGEVPDKIISTVHSAKLNVAVRNTMRWFERLVKLADDDWAKYKQHRSITDLQRSACTFLALEREWNFNVMVDSNKLCWGCKSPIHVAAIVCGQCRAILNLEEYNKRKSQFAEVG